MGGIAAIRSVVIFGLKHFLKHAAGVKGQRKRIESLRELNKFYTMS